MRKFALIIEGRVLFEPPCKNQTCPERSRRITIRNTHNGHRSSNPQFCLFPFNFLLSKPMNHLTTHRHRESSYLRAYKAPLHLSRALYKFTLFMQNKPNFWKSQMNVNKVLTRNYEKKTLGEHGKNKPNTNPIQTQTNPIRTRFPKYPNRCKLSKNKEL